MNKPRIVLPNVTDEIRVQSHIGQMRYILNGVVLPLLPTGEQWWRIYVNGNMVKLANNGLSMWSSERGARESLYNALRQPFLSYLKSSYSIDFSKKEIDRIRHAVLDRMEEQGEIKIVLM